MDLRRRKRRLCTNGVILNTYDHLLHFRKKAVKKAHDPEEKYIPLHQILEIAFEYVSQEGFISLVSEKSGGLVSTSTRVRNWFRDKESTVLKTLGRETEKNAKDCIEWVRGWDVEIVEKEVNTFSNKVSQIFFHGNNTEIGEKQIPMVCGVIPKFLYNGKELKHCINSEFVGEINEPYEGFSKLMKIDHIPERGSSVFKTRDPKGNIVTFWEKPEFGRKDNLEIADCFTFKGIVIQKFNSDWDNGLPVTCLNKVRLIKNYGKPK